MRNSFRHSFLAHISYSSILLALIVSLGACKSTKQAQGSADVLPQALLWKVESKELQEPSYVFGTIHMIPKEDFFLPVGFEEVFNKVDKIIFEIDLDEMSDMGSLMGMMANVMMQDGMTLRKLLTKEEYAEVSDYFENMGMPMMLLDRVKPMFLSMLAQVNMDPGQLESDDITSYEMDIYEKAKAKNLDVGGLETMAYQMSLFDKIPYSDQAKMLLEAVRSVSSDSESFDAIVELYKQQNIEAMVQMVGEEGSGGMAEYEDILLSDRNKNWIPKMAERMKKRPMLFAVGAGHLGGPEGVIRLLRKEGYKVTPVSVFKGRTAVKL